MSRFFSEVERIHPYLSPFDKGNGLIEFEFVSEEYEEIEGGSYFAIFEQRLPRMQPVVTYEIPAPPIPGMHINASTTLRMFGEAHALTKVVLNAYEDHLSPDPWTQPRQFTYFRALGEVLAAEWIGEVNLHGWFLGQAGTDIETYQHGSMTILRRQYASCDPFTNALCPPRQMRWFTTFTTNLDPNWADLPSPSCDDNPRAHYIATGKRCP